MAARPPRPYTMPARATFAPMGPACSCSPTTRSRTPTGSAGSANDAVVDEQRASGRERAADGFELDGWQAVEQSSSAAGDARRDHEPELVDNVGGEQRLRDRDARVDADIASGLLLEIPNEFGEPAFEHRRIGPILVKGRRC